MRETRGRFPRGNIPGDSTGKGAGNIQLKNSPSFLPECPQGNYEEVSTGIIPLNWRGNLGDGDGSPAGDEGTGNMLFDSNYFGACLNKLCTVTVLRGFGNTEKFNVKTLRTVLRTRIEDFVGV